MVPTQGEVEEEGRQYNRQYIYTTNHLRSPISLEQSGFYDPSIPPTRFRLIFVENHLNNNTIDHPQAQTLRCADHPGTEAEENNGQYGGSKVA